MDPAALVSFMTLGGLIAMMLSMGLKVKFEAVLTSIRQPRLTVLAIVANFVLVPAVTALLLRLFDAVPPVSIGFLILAVCPGAPVGPPFAAIAKGDVPCAIGQMVILAVLSAIVSPVLLSFLLAQLPTSGEMHIDYFAIVRTLLVSQILPLTIGLGIRQWRPLIAERIARPIGLVANLLLLAVIILLLARENETLALIRLRGWLGMLLLLSVSLAIGWLLGGPARATRKSLALTTAVRNAAVALVIVSSNFAGTPAVTAVIAYALVSIFATLGCAFLLAALPETVVD